MGRNGNLRLFGLFFIVMILNGLTSAIEKEIECKFENLDLPFSATTLNPIPTGQFYTCTLLTEINSEVAVTGVKGQHIGTKTDDLVEVLIVKSIDFIMFPENLGETFKNLKGIYIEETNLEILQDKDLISYASTLEYLTVKTTNIMFLGEKLLNGLAALKFVDFSNNPISYFAKTTFNGPTELKVLDLSELLCTSSDLYEKTSTGDANAAFKGLAGTDPCLLPSSLELAYLNTFNKYMGEKTSSYENSQNLVICEEELNSCLSEEPTKNPVTTSTTTNPVTTTSTSFVCDCTTTKSEATTVTNGPTTPTVETTTLSTTLSPEDCETRLNLMVIEKNKFFNYTEVCVAERDDLKKEVEELYNEIEKVSPSNFTCRFRTSENGYECLAMKISIKSDSSLSAQKITWVGRHADKNSNDQVISLQIKSQVAQLMPLEIGKSFKNLENLIVESSGLQKLKKNDFKTLDNLKKLSIVGNDISSIESGAFSILEGLEYLNLRGNKIATFPSRAFETLKDLIHLDLGDNKFSSFRYDMIPATNKIKHFYADSNLQLGSVDILMIWRLSKAEFIDLHGTGCGDLKFNKTLTPSFKSFYNQVVAKCS